MSDTRTWASWAQVKLSLSLYKSTDSLLTYIISSQEVGSKVQEQAKDLATYAAPIAKVKIYVIYWPYD